jgi:hypothetical protein
MDYQERQDDWVEKNNIKVGDKVRVLRKANDFEGGWYNIWNSGMDEFIGQESVITMISSIFLGIKLRCLRQTLYYSFPYSVLKKVSEQPQPQKNDLCPRCSATLTRVRSYTYNEEIDKCPACGWC